MSENFKSTFNKTTHRKLEHVQARNRNGPARNRHGIARKRHDQARDRQKTW